MFTIYQEPFWINAVTNTFDELLAFYFACELVGIEKEKVEQLVNVLEGKTFTFPQNETKNAFKYAFIYWRIVTTIPEMFPDHSYERRHDIRKKALREVCNRFGVEESEITKAYKEFLIKNDLKAVCVCGNHFEVKKSKRLLLNCPVCTEARKSRK